MIKKIISIGLTLIMCLSLFGGCSSGYLRDYDWSDDSFSFEIVANKTEARIGDEIEFMATFKNLSGKNLWITVPYWGPRNGAENIIGKAPRWISATDHGFYRLSKDEIIIQIQRIVITERMVGRAYCMYCSDIECDRCKYESQYDCSCNKCLCNMPFQLFHHNGMGFWIGRIRNPFSRDDAVYRFVSLGENILINIIGWG